MLRFNDEFIPPGAGAALTGLDQLAWLFQHGRPTEKEPALRRLILAAAESVLAACLAATDLATVQLAAAGFWECGLNEKGPEARRRKDEGVERLSAGDLAGVQKIFHGLSVKHPDWAEAINKKATVLYLRGRAGESLALCRRVVEMKPHHFGAWNGMALCAVQLEYWHTALDAAKRALSLQPGATVNLETIRLAKSKLAAP
ncbi:MAG: hypothetical protein EXS33_07170 [Pedosphaera sp.]|nr:hypothetical protein [Pedosphaera sp.]